MPPAPAPYISSTQNRQIRQALKLRQRSAREETGRTLVEGEQEIRRAMANRIPFYAVYACPPLARNQALARLLSDLERYARECSAAFLAVSPHVHERLALRRTTGAAVVEARLPRRGLRDLPMSARAPYVVLEDADRPGNVGGVLRTMHAVGAAALLLAQQEADGTDVANPNVIRSSLGTVFDVPSVQARGGALIRWLQRQQCAIVAATPEGRSLFEAAAWPARTAFVFGSEARGLSAAWRAAAHAHVAVPMRKEAVDSLNLSVSVAVVLYEHWRRQECAQTGDAAR